MQLTSGNARRAHLLFVCTGNICRSAFAEVCLASRLRSTSTAMVRSAGVMAVVGNAMEPQMAREAAMRGIDASAHRAQQLTGRLLKGADIVMVFGPEHAEWIAREYPEYLGRVVSLGQLAAVLRVQPRRALMNVNDLVRDVRQQRPEVADEDWIEDPFHKGKQAMARAADAIWNDVELMVNRIEWPS